MNGPTTHTVATAGHVDHGKSTLVRALTGTDPDRFAEERERGMTIDLGFAFCSLASGRRVGFVDVPGHVRFIKNMLAGVGAVGSCLFVVAADDGWMPQSEEHLRILELLGISEAVVALTKVAMVDEARRAEAHDLVAEHLATSALAGAEIVEVDAPAGFGLDTLCQALERMLDRLGPPVDSGRARLWLDRVFAAKGAGTIVTGSLAGGAIALGDELVAVPGAPPSFRPLAARVRGIQTDNAALEVATPASRVALNLVGPERRQLARGQALVQPGRYEPSSRFDVSLQVLAALGHDVARRGAYQFYVGSTQLPASLRLLGTSVLSPGELGAARIHLPVPLALLPGDRYVLRESGRGETVGGGEVLDVDPVLPARHARPDRSVDRVVRERGFVDAALLGRLTGMHRPPNLGRFVADEAAVATLASHLAERLAAAGGLGIELSALDERERVVLEHLEGAVIDKGKAMARAAADDGIAELGVGPYLAALGAAPFSPPEPRAEGVSDAALRELVRRGLVVASSGYWFSTAAICEAAATVRSLLDREPEGVTVSAVRDALGTSRKYALPLLAALDGLGATRRHEDLRVAGPRLDELAGAPPVTPQGVQ